MPLTISTTKKPRQGVAFVIFLFEWEDFWSAPIAAFFEKSEVQYLRSITPSLTVKEGEVKMFIAPRATGERKIFLVGLSKEKELQPAKAGCDTYCRESITERVA